MIEKQSQGLIDIAELVFKFANVNRATFYPDGKRMESDTDHTVMLSVIACALADKLYKDTLGIGEVAQFALIHDLVEAYAGDTISFDIKEEDKIDKEIREKEALERIKKEFDNVFPWIGKKIEEYDSLSTKEARFVKLLDKFMPKVTHCLNKGRFFQVNNIKKDYTVVYLGKQHNNLSEKFGDEFKELLLILKDLNNKVVEKII